MDSMAILNGLLLWWGGVRMG